MKRHFIYPKLVNLNSLFICLSVTTYSRHVNTFLCAIIFILINVILYLFLAPIDSKNGKTAYDVIIKKKRYLFPIIGLILAFSIYYIWIVIFYFDHKK